MKPHILITGAGGFIGHSLISLLASEGKSLRIASRNLTQNHSLYNEYGISPVPFDLDINNNDYDALLDNVQLIVHLAARVHINDQGNGQTNLFRKTNTLGTQKLAEEASKRGVKRFIYISTAKVYGEKSSLDNGMAHAFNEEDTTNPIDDYAKSKLKAEQAIKKICAESNMDSVIFRPPLVYGPGVKANFYSLLNVVGKGYPLPFASVKNLRSFVYVENLAHAILTSIKSPEAINQTYIVSDIDISVPGLIRKIAHSMGKRSPLFSCSLILLKVAGMILFKSDMISRLTESLIVDSSRIRNDLQWSPPYNFDEGLQKTVNWYRSRQ